MRCGKRIAGPFRSHGLPMRCSMAYLACVWKEPPELTEAEVVAMVRIWTTELSGLKLMLVGMSEGATLDDALRAHREATQAGRRPSRVMRADGD